MSGLGRTYGKAGFDLRDPVDGHALSPDELHGKRYDAGHCRFCANRAICNGCLECGRCGKDHVLVDERGLHDAELAALAASPPLAYQVYSGYSNRK